MKKSIKYTFLAFCMVMIVNFIFFYGNYSQNQINHESKRYLQEICTQINDKITTVTTNNWLILREWNELITLTAGENSSKLQTFIDENQRQRQFSDFYFLAENGNYLTINGKEGYFNLGKGGQQLMLSGEDVVIEVVLPSGKKAVIFAVPVEKNTFRDFTYSAIGITYTTEQLASTLNIDTYSGIGICHVAHPDGRIIVNSHPEDSQYYNLITYLKQNASIQEKSVEDIINDWSYSQADAVRFDVDGVSYYLSYQTVGFSDWVLLGLVPAETVSAEMNQYTVTTLLVMGSVFALLFICVAVLIITRSRKQIQTQRIKMNYQQKLFDALSQNTNDVFLLFSGKDYKVTYVSPNIHRVLGLTVEEVLKDIHALSAILVETTVAPFNKEVLLNITPDSPWISTRAYHNKITDQIRWFYSIMKYTPIEEKNDLYLMALFDRTEDRRINMAMEDALNAANAANDSKRNFLANMSHDIRTPMNAIMGFTDLINQDINNPTKIKDYTRKISASSQHLLSLVNDILDMSKIESGKTSLNNTKFRFSYFLDEIKDMLTPQADSKKQKFSIIGKGHFPQYLLGDKLRLNQILTNILTNALKYTPEGGTITMTAEVLETSHPNYVHLRFTVEDNGCGMTPEFLEHIFDPFTRERTMHATEIQGTGLGMAITNTLVTLMGGTIQVASTPGVGSIFTVDLTFPLADDIEQPETEKNDNTLPQKSLEGLRILAAEDYSFNADLLVRLLEYFKVSCDITSNGKEALEKFLASEAGYYNMIILDIQMPVMNGYEAARQIRSSAHPDALNIPIVAMTANAFEDDVKQALDTGMTAHASKPIGKDKLQDILLQYS